MAEKEATRVAYGRKLAELGEKYDFYVLDADLRARHRPRYSVKNIPTASLTQVSRRAI